MLSEKALVSGNNTLYFLSLIMKFYACGDWCVLAQTIDRRRPYQGYEKYEITVLKRYFQPNTVAWWAFHMCVVSVHSCKHLLL